MPSQCLHPKKGHSVESHERNEIFITFDMVHCPHTSIIEAIFPYNNGQEDLVVYNNKI